MSILSHERTRLRDINYLETCKVVSSFSRGLRYAILYSQKDTEKRRRSVLDIARQIESDAGYLFEEARYWGDTSIGVLESGYRAYIHRNGKKPLLILSSTYDDY